MATLHRSPSLLLLSVGIFLGVFSQLVSPFPNNGLSSILLIPRIGLDRSSKDNGFPENRAEYATHRPYKTDFDLLRVSERSQELEMPLLQNNDLDGERDTTYYLSMDPTLRSRRKRQVNQAQMFFGMPSTNVNLMGPQTSAFAVQPSASAAIFIPSTFSPSSPSISSSSAMPAQFMGGLSRNDLAILNYYQQQLTPPQAPNQQQIVFQGPTPNQRQRPELQGIHTKYPYPYPPTDVQPSGAVPESAGPEGITGDITTDYPAGTTLLPGSTPQQQDPSFNNPDNPYLQQQQPPVGQPSTSNPNGGPTTSQAPPAPPSTSSAPPPSTRPPQPEQIQQIQQNAPQQQQGQQLNQALKNQVVEKEDIIRQLSFQLEQANLQIASYEQENAVYKEYKEQYARAEEANVKLRERVQQLENTNQHLQEQYGQLQQVNSEHKQQMNSLRDTQKELMAQVEDFRSQMIPLSKEVQTHRKEVEEFLIRIRKLGEENETLKEQVKLYQLKINYIQAQQNRQQQQPNQFGSPSPPPAPSSSFPAPASSPVQPQLKKQPEPQKQKLPQTSSPVLVAHVDDDELDPELQRMDNEIAALQKNAAELAAVIKNLPQPPQGIMSDGSDAAGVKNQNEFPGEAVQVSQQRNQQEQAAGETARAPSASRTIPAWEKPAGF